MSNAEIGELSVRIKVDADQCLEVLAEVERRLDSIVDKVKKLKAEPIFTPATGGLVSSPDRHPVIGE